MTLTLILFGLCKNFTATNWVKLYWAKLSAGWWMRSSQNGLVSARMYNSPRYSIIVLHTPESLRGLMNNPG